MGKDFESRRKEYLDCLRSNFELFEMMKINEKKQGDTLMVKRMLLDPKTEEELSFAVLTLDFTDLAVRAATGDVKTISPKNNIYLNLLVDVMNSLKGNKDVEYMVAETKKNAAKCLYDYVIGFVNDTDTTISYLAKETGYDLYDDFELEQFQLYLEKANSIINVSEPKVQQGIVSNEELKNMSDEFHRLCEKGRLKNKVRRKSIFGR